MKAYVGIVALLREPFWSAQDAIEGALRSMV